MNRLLKGIFVSSVIGAFVLISAGVQAQDGAADRKEKREEMREKWAEELGLTAEQKEALKQSNEAAKAGREATRGNLKAARTALMEELKKTEIDQAALDKAVLDVKEAEGDIVDSRVKSFLSMKEILTAEQFQKMSEMRDKWIEKKGERKHHGGENLGHHEE